MMSLTLAYSAGDAPGGHRSRQDQAHLDGDVLPEPKEFDLTRSPCA